jgi:hypothetical protein
MAGITWEIASLQDMLTASQFLQLIVTMLFYSYYPLTRQIVFTYFASPATYGVLTSQRFDTLLWWMVALTIFALPPLVWIGEIKSHWRRRSYKITFIIYASFLIAWWAATIGVQTWWIVTRNTPSFADNPANSYRACCTPEFYNTVGACPNFGAPHPECDPAINIGELGTNGDMIFYYAITWGLTIIWVVYLVLTVNLLRTTDVYEKMLRENLLQQAMVPMKFPDASDSDGSTLELTGTPSTSGNATTVPTLLSQSSVRNVVQQRVRATGVFEVPVGKK